MKCRGTKPGKVRQELSDGGGLQLWIQPNGSRLWQLIYQFGGKQAQIALVAYDATNGDKLWSFDAQATAQGGPVSYSVNGEQYIAIAVGNGSSTWLAAGMFVPERKAPPLGRVIVFKLGGKAPFTRVDMRLDPVPVPPVVPVTPDQFAKGERLYGAYCAGCHGFAAISGHVTPDLRRSPYIQDAEAFRSVIQDGLLLSLGMPKFGKQISTNDLEGIRAYLAGEARYLRDVAAGKITGHPNAGTAPQVPDAGPQ